MAFIEALTLVFALLVAVAAYRRSYPRPAFAGAVVMTATALLTLWLSSAVLARLLPQYHSEPAPMRVALPRCAGAMPAAHTGPP